MKSSIAVIVALILTVACAPPPAKTYPVMPAALAPITLTHDRATAFGRIFCGTLQHFQDPNGRSWGDCAQYVGLAQAGSVPMAFTSRFRLLLVGGLGDDCLTERARAFAQGIIHLHEVHQVDVETIRTPPFASSTETGHVIARIINERWMADPAHRPYVLLGYSKGAADIEEATRDLPMIRDQVAAVVTIAGLVNGTPEPRAMGPLFDAGRPWTDHHCPTMGSLLSLSPTVRHDFLRAHPLPVPAYSLVAISTESATSPILHGSWKRLSHYAAEQDGVVVAWDAVLPDATYLGVARADHLAVALALDDGKKGGKTGDPSRFPRDALLEAVVRFVTQ